MNVIDQSATVLKPLIIYCLEHDMFDTAEFTAERLLAQENKSTTNNEIGSFSTSVPGSADDVNTSGLVGTSRGNKGGPIGTPTPHSIHGNNLRIEPDINRDIDFEGTKHASSSTDRKGSLLAFGGNSGVSTSKLDAVHLYATVLFRRGRFKAAYNATADYCTLHVGCSYIFAKACKELLHENEGIRALLRTMNKWETKVESGITRGTNLNNNNGNRLIPDSIAYYMLLAKLYAAVGDIPRASMHYSQVLKLNPFIFEAFEELCRMGVHVKVDSIYKAKDFTSSNSLFQTESSTNVNDGTRLDEPILEAEMEQDIELHEDNAGVGEIGQNKKERLFSTSSVEMNIDKPREKVGKNAIFKTPKTKIKPPVGITTSSPESSFITPVTKKSQSYKPNKSLSSNRNNLSSIPRIGSSITSRLLHNPPVSTVQINNGSNNLEEDVNFIKKDTTVGSKRDMLSAFGVSHQHGNVGTNSDVFNSGNMTNKISNGFKYVRNGGGLNSVFNGLYNSTSLFDEHDIMKNLNNEYLLSVYSKLAKGYLASTSYDCFKAIRIFDSLPENERNTPWVLSKLGRLHFEIVNYEEADNYFEKLRKMDRTRLEDMEYYSTLLWHLHKEVELSFLAHELYEIDNNSPISWICIGNLFSFKKEPEEAIKCFMKAVKVDPSCAYAYTLKGHEYLATDAFEAALVSFRHAIVIDKRHYNAFYGIGMVYLKLGDFRKAEFHFRKAVEINPVNVILICCVGMVLEKLGKKEESLKQYEFASKLQPLSMLALFKKAQVLFGMKRYDEALKDFEKLENLAPDEASVHFLLGKLYKHFGQKHDAIKQFTIALNLDPKGSHLIKEAMENLNDGMLE